jgi:uncharacterized protein (TIGR03083 family)
MNSMTPTSVQDIPPLTRAEARTLARVEYERFIDVLRGLHPEDASRATDCTEWTVKDVVAHVVGETEGFASLRETVHQWRRGPRARRKMGAAQLIDGVNDVQVRERRHLTLDQLSERMTAAAGPAARTRANLPTPLRAIPLSLPAVGRRSLGYLYDRVITRDVWMHRVDIVRAAGTPLTLTSDHDGRLIADIVADWSTTHSDPFRLRLTGPSGGTYTRGQPTAATDIDAVEFVRIISGRAAGQNVLAHPLPL